ncbi:hypothetical protein [Puerhibacterium puerhi]|uniref:hypothetical protein n=1 Tax=Puerhibacterium puerhi TaxID=2692623 RepID=UPI00135BAABE|nr:hypothetical protein [Puerhibacterium puerhi]
MSNDQSQMPGATDDERVPTPDVPEEDPYLEEEPELADAGPEHDPAQPAGTGAVSPGRVEGAGGLAEDQGLVPDDSYDTGQAAGADSAHPETRESYDTGEAGLHDSAQTGERESFDSGQAEVAESAETGERESFDSGQAQQDPHLVRADDPGLQEDRFDAG